MKRFSTRDADETPSGDLVRYDDVLPLIDAAKDFVAKVKSGRARSVDSFQKFALALRDLGVNF